MSKEDARKHLGLQPPDPDDWDRRLVWMAAVLWTIASFTTGYLIGASGFPH